MADPSPFSPGNSASLSVTTATGNVALPTGIGYRFLLSNEGTNTIYFAVGGSSVAATTSNTPLLGGMWKVFTLDPTAGFIAGITSTSTAILHITRGEGN